MMEKFVHLKEERSMMGVVRGMVWVFALSVIEGVETVIDKWLKQ